MRIKIYSNQEREPNRIEGPFKLLAAGIGDYAEAMSEFTGRRFESARDLIDLIRTKPSGEKCTYILGRDMLRIENPSGGEEIERKYKYRDGKGLGFNEDKSTNVIQTRHELTQPGIEKNTINIKGLVCNRNVISACL